MNKTKDQLSVKEKRDRTRLEQVGSDRICAAQTELAQIEKLGLWHSSHKTFENYCTERFGFNPLKLDVEELIKKLG